jgi:hypothetical protein
VSCSQPRWADAGNRVFWRNVAADRARRQGVELAYVNSVDRISIARPERNQKPLQPRSSQVPAQLWPQFGFAAARFAKRSKQEQSATRTLDAVAAVNREPMVERAWS